MRTTSGIGTSRGGNAIDEGPRGGEPATIADPRAPTRAIATISRPLAANEKDRRANADLSPASLLVTI
jgi:hypothetical protein